MVPAAARQGADMQGPRYRLAEPEVALEAFDGDAVLIDFRSGSYYSLSPSAAAILTRLAAGRTPEEIAADLAATVGAEAAQVASDARAVLAQLLADDVLMPTDGGAAATSVAPLALDGAWAAPVLERFEDMREMLLLDPIHEVDLAGWPVQAPSDAPPA